jgi:hypothetical protein
MLVLAGGIPASPPYAPRRRPSTNSASSSPAKETNDICLVIPKSAAIKKSEIQKPH